MDDNGKHLGRGVQRHAAAARAWIVKRRSHLAKLVAFVVVNVGVSGAE